MVTENSESLAAWGTLLPLLTWNHLWGPQGLLAKDGGCDHDRLPDEPFLRQVCEPLSC